MDDGDWMDDYPAETQELDAAVDAAVEALDSALNNFVQAGADRTLASQIQQWATGELDRRWVQVEVEEAFTDVLHHEDEVDADDTAPPDLPFELLSSPLSPAAARLDEHNLDEHNLDAQSLAAQLEVRLNEILAAAIERGEHIDTAADTALELSRIAIVWFEQQAR